VRFGSLRAPLARISVTCAVRRVSASATSSPAVSVGISDKHLKLVAGKQLISDYIAQNDVPAAAQMLGIDLDFFFFFFLWPFSCLFFPLQRSAFIKSFRSSSSLSFFLSFFLPFLSSLSSLNPLLFPILLLLSSYRLQTLCDVSAISPTARCTLL
jgi:hypothetical protein